MATTAIKATGSQITFCDTKDISRTDTAMGILLQKYLRLFRELWPQNYPELSHVEYCLPSNLLTLYAETQEIKYWMLEDSSISCLENKCREILIKIIEETLI